MNSAKRLGDRPDPPDRLKSQVEQTGDNIGAVWGKIKNDTNNLGCYSVSSTNTGPTIFAHNNMEALDEAQFLTRSEEGMGKKGNVALNHLIGDWKVDGEFYLAGFGPRTESDGYMSVIYCLKENYIKMKARTELKTEEPLPDGTDANYFVEIFIGYDPVTEGFTLSKFDSTTRYPLIMKGSFNEKKRDYTFYGKIPSFYDYTQLQEAKITIELNDDGFSYSISLPDENQSGKWNMCLDCNLTKEIEQTTEWVQNYIHNR